MGYPSASRWPSTPSRWSLLQDIQLLLSTPRSCSARLDAADKRVEQLAERVGVLIGRIEVLERAWRVAMKKLGGNAINIEDTRE